VGHAMTSNSKTRPDYLKADEPLNVGSMVTVPMLGTLESIRGYYHAVGRAALATPGCMPMSREPTDLDLRQWGSQLLAKRQFHVAVAMFRELYKRHPHSAPRIQDYAQALFASGDLEGLQSLAREMGACAATEARSPEPGGTGLVERIDERARMPVKS
jgi:hypothetical protein